MARVIIAVGVFVFMTISQVFTSQQASAAQYGKASYYWQPQPLASGGRFNPNAMSAAHKTLPFGTQVRVTRQSTGRSVVVTINDRGPYITGRIIDLSRAAAQRLGMTAAGVTRVRVDVIGRGGVRHLALGGKGGQYAHVHPSTRTASLASGGKKQPRLSAPPNGEKHVHPSTRTASLASGGKKQPRKSAPPKGEKHVHPSTRTASLASGGKKQPPRSAPPKGQKHAHPSTRTASLSSGGKKQPRKSARPKVQRFAGIPKSLRGKKIISVKRRYTIGGKIRTTSGLIPKGATLLMEEITYIN